MLQERKQRKQIAPKKSEKGLDMANQISLKPKKTNFAQMKRGLKKVSQTAPVGNDPETLMQLEMNEDINN